MFIVKPVITEKAFNQSRNGVYTFRVDGNMRKDEIIRLINAQYGVTVHNIRTVKMASKTKRVGRTRQEVRIDGWKKVYVTLGKDQSLDFFTVKE